jgi:ribonuclease P protein component
MEHLRRRQDFLAAAKAPYQSMPGLVIQLRARDDEAPARIGFTVTKRCGNAVTRNRIRRRLREAARLRLPALAKSGHDYVVIGRAAALTRSFSDLQTDLETAIAKLHRSPGKMRGRNPT